MKFDKYGYVNNWLIFMCKCIEEEKVSIIRINYIKLRIIDFR